MVTQDVGKNMIAACLVSPLKVTTSSCSVGAKISTVYLQNGKVNLDDRFSSRPGVALRNNPASYDTPKRGGDILLKDAFGTTIPPIPPGRVSNIGNAADADTSTHEMNHYKSASGQLKYAEKPDLFAATSRSASYIQDEFYIPPTAPDTNLVKVPRLTSKRHRSPGSSLLVSDHPYLYSDTHEKTNINNDDAEGSEDDLSEGECEAQMRQIRRSLSIERRFEKAEEEERPRLLRSADSKDTMINDGTDGEAERNNMFNPEMRRKEGWSFTASEDAWNR